MQWYFFVLRLDLAVHISFKMFQKKITGRRQYELTCSRETCKNIRTTVDHFLHEEYARQFHTSLSMLIEGYDDESSQTSLVLDSYFVKSRKSDARAMESNERRCLLKDINTAWPIDREEKIILPVHSLGLLFRKGAEEQTSKTTTRKMLRDLWDLSGALLHVETDEQPETDVLASYMVQAANKYGKLRTFEGSTKQDIIVKTEATYEKYAMAFIAIGMSQSQVALLRILTTGIPKQYRTPPLMHYKTSRARLFSRDIPVVEKVLPSGAKSACIDPRYYARMWLKQIGLPKGVPLIRRDIPFLLVDVAPGGRALTRCVCYSC